MTKSQGILICGRDFNVRLHPKIDSSNGKPNAKKMSKKMNNFMKEVGITDVWRANNRAIVTLLIILGHTMSALEQTCSGC